MSRIGKLPITIPAGVTVTMEGNTMKAKGSLGELVLDIHPRIMVEIGESKILVKRKTDENFDKSLHGLMRTLINNLVVGVSQGYEKQLEIHGVGYKASVSGEKLNLSLGFSHPVDVKAPSGITFEINKESKNVIIIRGIDKQLVGETAANIRALRKPEPYKGKGIRYVGEYVPRKIGKAAAKEK